EHIRTIVLANEDVRRLAELVVSSHIECMLVVVELEHIKQCVVVLLEKISGGEFFRTEDDPSGSVVNGNPWEWITDCASVISHVCKGEEEPVIRIPLEAGVQLKRT